MPVIMVQYKTVAELVAHVHETINETKGRWFRATFARRTKGKKGELAGSLRTGTFRIGVAAYVTGVGMSYEPKVHNLRSVWESGNKDGDKQEDAYRCIPVDTMQEITSEGVTTIYRLTPAV